MRRRFVLVILCFASIHATAVNPRAVAEKVRGGPFFSKTATAWCLTPMCDVMITNAHVVQAIHGRMTVKGVPVDVALPASGPGDEGARPLPGFVEDFNLNWVRDIALLRMKKPLSTKGMRGIKLFTGQLRHGESMTLIAYPSGQLLVTPAQFDRVGRDGILQFNVDAQIGPGASGGLVLNDHDQAVAILFAAAGIERKAFFAVPIWSIAQFVQRSDPALYASLFPVEPFQSAQQPIPVAISDTAGPSVAAVGGLTPAQILPATYLAANLSQPWPAQPPQSLQLQVRREEPPEIQSLRRSAHRLANEMKNFIALQTLTLPGGVIWQHQVRVVDGQQTFRSADGTELNNLPIPRAGAVPGAEWETLPEMVATNLKLPVQYVGERTIATLAVKVFEYNATAEDGVCRLRVGRGVFHKMWIGAAPCHGEVWTDRGYNIIRITQEMLVPRGSGAERFQTVVLYGWLRPTHDLTRLVPTSIHLTVKMARGDIYETEGRYSDYRMFHATAVIH